MEVTLGAWAWEAAGRYVEEVERVLPPEGGEEGVASRLRGALPGYKARLARRGA